MQPIVQKEFYLAKAAGLYDGEVPNPVTTTDYYYAALCGKYVGELPEPVTAEQKYLANLLGEDVAVPKPITLDDIFMYDAVMRIVAEEPVTRQQYYWRLIAKSRQYINKTASGNPITLTDSAENKPLGKTLYGWSKQDGTPSPENPVEIESAGMKWSTGAQLFDASKLDGMSLYGVTLHIKDGIIYAEGEATENAWITVNLTKDEIQRLFEDGKYTITKQKFGNVNFDAGLYFRFIPSTFRNGTIELTIPESIKDGDVYYFINITKGVKHNGGIRVILNKGDTALPYEPYTGGIPKPYGDKVGIGVYGKNLFDERLLDNKDNYDKQYQSMGFWKLAIPVKNGSVTISVKNTTNWGGYLCVNSTGIVGGEWMAHGSVPKLKRTVTLTSTHGFIYLLMSTSVDDNKRTLEEVGYIQVEYGTEATSYEPYKQPQSTYIITPNGLPGIPVPSNTAGITYTDANGQAWIADEIDLERGKYVQRIGKVDLENLLWKLIGNCFRSGAISDSKVYKWTSEIANIICSHYICKMTSYNMQYNSDGQDNLIGMYANQIEIKDTRYNKDVDLFKQSLSGVYAYYVLAIPVERNLTSAELAEYTQLYSYKPTTVVENDSDCWMDVTALCKPK